MGSGHVIHLLVLTESSHDAEVLSNGIRNSGHAVRSRHVENDDGLNKALKEQQSWDLLITAPTFNGHSALQALETINHSGKDLPCIVFGNQPDAKAQMDLLRAGAANCISSNEQDVLLLNIERALGNLWERRAHRLSRAALTESEKRNRALLDSSRDAICYIHEGMHIYANLSYVEAFGYDNIEEMGSIPIMDLIASEDQQPFKELLQTLSKGRIPEEELEFQAVHSEGEKFNAAMEFSAARIDGESCTQIVIRRHTDNAQLEQELEQLRKQDLLTSLFNRQYFMDEIDKAVTSASQGKSVSTMLFIQPDNFTAIKDTLGIAGSDMVLTDIANLLRDNIPDGGKIARFAGTIFTVIFNDKTTDEIGPVAEVIRSAFERTIFEVDEKTVSTTCSIGVAPITETTSDSKKALSNADGACEIAKKEGGNRIHTHTMADELVDLEEDRAWAERIRLAIQGNRFVLYYQPIVSLHAEPGERYEVLIRMLDEKNNLVLPNQFLKAAENSDLMTEIDRWVMKNAAKALLEKRRNGVEIRFFVKLSNDSLDDPTLLPWISKLLKAARLHGASMAFEVSEAAALNNLKATKTLSKGLHQLHCLFALDHVGNDNPSLNYLRHFDVDYLKIDGSHIRSLTQSESSQDLIKSISELARNKDILTIAEHVQDPACLALLWQHGINLIQGHYFQEPEGALAYDFTAE